MQAWENFLTKQKIDLGEAIVKKWLEPLRVVRFDAGNLYLEAKDHFQALWFEEHVRPKIRTNFVNNNNRAIKVHLSIANQKPSVATPQKGKKKQQREEESKPFTIIFDELDPLATFETFIPAETNIIPTKLLQEITAYLTGKKSEQLPSEDLSTYNPVYLHGFNGSGKTHLLQSVTHLCRQAKLKCIYARSETFTNHVVNAIRAGEMSTFRQTYRNADVLIIDDVHLFSRKGATQEELFHTFNALHLAGKQIILSANCAPKELQMIEPRLISRFEWGIVLPIGCLEKEGLHLMLQKKCEKLRLPLNPSVKNYLLETFSSGATALSRALEALVLRSQIDEESVTHDAGSLTVQEVKHLLSDLAKEEEAGKISADTIIEKVAEYFAIPTDDIKGKSQKKEATLPRQLTMFLCRHKLDMPFTKIGEFFSRDHSTVMTSVKRVKKSIQEGEKDLTEALQSVLAKLQR